MKPFLNGEKRVVLDFDGVEGLPSSFLEEIFGGLVRQGFSVELLRGLIDIRASDPELAMYPKMAWRFATEAEQLH